MSNNFDAPFIANCNPNIKPIIIEEIHRLYLDQEFRERFVKRKEK